MGATNSGREYEWRWVTGEKLSYTRWLPHHCQRRQWEGRGLYMLSDGQWFGIREKDWAMPFLVEWEDLEREYSYALEFNDHYVHVPHHAALNPGSDNFTIEAWGKLYSSGNAGDAWDLVVAKRSPNGYYLGMQRGHGWNFMLSDDQGKRTDTNSDRAIAEIYDRWVFVQAVVDRGNQRQILRVYDPQQSVWHEAAVAPPGHIGSTDDLYFGKDVNAGRFASHSLLGPIRFWRTARTREQAEADMHERLSGSEQGLAGYWPVDEGEGNRLTDRTESANHGSVVGAHWTKQMPAGPLKP